MNRLHQLFERKQKNLLSIYLTVGYPTMDHAVDLILSLDRAGVDFLEVGMPFSDPMADGPTIQQTSQVALEQGMTIPRYFELLREARSQTQIPMVFMGYLNQVYRMGVETFCKACKESGIDAAIIPDLPMDIYRDEFQEIFERHNLPISFLISPQTSEARIRQADALSGAFVYVVADNSITGSSSGISDAQVAYFERIAAMQLNSPTIIGFGISDQLSFETACAHANGAIVGSAFLRSLSSGETNVSPFIESIRPKPLSV